MVLDGAVFNWCCVARFSCCFRLGCRCRFGFRLLLLHSPSLFHHHLLAAFCSPAAACLSLLPLLPLLLLLLPLLLLPSHHRLSQLFQFLQLCSSPIAFRFAAAAAFAFATAAAFFFARSSPSSLVSALLVLQLAPAHRFTFRCCRRFRFATLLPFSSLDHQSSLVCLRWCFFTGGSMPIALRFAAAAAFAFATAAAFFFARSSAGSSTPEASACLVFLCLSCCSCWLCSPPRAFCFAKFLLLLRSTFPCGLALRFASCRCLRLC